MMTSVYTKTSTFTPIFVHHRVWQIAVKEWDPDGHNWVSYWLGAPDAPLTFGQLSEAYAVMASLADDQERRDGS